MSQKFNLHTKASSLNRGDIAKWLPFTATAPTDELLPAIGAFNNEVAAANQQSADIEHEVSVAVAAATSGGSAEDLVQATNKRRTLVLSDAQNLLRLWRARLELTEQYAEACKTAATAAKAEAEEIKTEVAGQAEAIGFTRGSAIDEQRRFDHMLRYSNARVREACNLAESLSEQSRDVGTIQRESSDGATLAEMYLKATIERVAHA